MGFDPGQRDWHTHGHTYFAEGCIAVCESEVSQAEADLCAANQVFICAHECQPDDPLCNFECPGDPLCVNCPPENPDCTTYDCPDDPRCPPCDNPDSPDCQYHCPGDERCVDCPPEDPDCGDCPPGDPTCATYTCPGDPRCPSGSLFYSITTSCTAVCPDGLGFTYTVPAGRFVALSQVMANRIASDAACRLANTHKLCLSSLPSSACTGATFEATIRASGNYLARFPYTDFWEIVSGALPDGLTFNGGFLTGGRASITGTPTTTGDFSFAIRITAPNGDYMQKAYTLHVLRGITNASPLPNAVPGITYSVQLLAPDFVDAHFEITNGHLPTGLSMDESGLITGQPTDNHKGYQFTVEVTNGQEEPIHYACQKTFVVNVSDTITPSIYGPIVESFGTFPAGTYRITYVQGALRYAPTFGWSLNCTDIIASDRYVVRYGATDVTFPGTGAEDFPTQTAVEAANADAHIDVVHPGGAIGVWLSDTLYADNQAGSPNPTFRIARL